MESNRMRRFLAYLIDFMLFYLSGILSMVILQFSFLENIAILMVLTIIIASLVIFILRDYLFRGRSIGKRIFKLRVVDVDTRAEPTAKQLIVKNLFLFMNLIDGLFLIFSGRSLGERATRTIVLHEQQLPCSDPLTDSAQLAPQRKKSTPKKRFVVAVVTILCVSVSLALIFTLALDAAKKQENYQIAYSYLVDSDAFAEMQADESQITLTGYSAETRIGNDGDSPSAVVTFTFVVRGQQYRVVCHKDGEMWYVCNDCTAFR